MNGSILLWVGSGFAIFPAVASALLQKRLTPLMRFLVDWGEAVSSRSLIAIYRPDTWAAGSMASIFTLPAFAVILVARAMGHQALCDAIGMGTFLGYLLCLAVNLGPARRILAKRS